MLTRLTCGTIIVMHNLANFFSKISVKLQFYKLYWAGIQICQEFAKLCPKYIKAYV